MSKNHKLVGAAIAALCWLTGCGDGSVLGGGPVQGDRIQIVRGTPSGDSIQGRVNATSLNSITNRSMGLVRETRLAGQAFDGSQPDQNSDQAVTTPDGRYTAFCSFATNSLVNLAITGLNSSRSQIYLRDNQTGEVDLLSRSSLTAANASCLKPSISNDGSRVTFYTGATNLGISTSNTHVVAWTASDSGDPVDPSNPGTLQIVDCRDTTVATVGNSNSVVTQQALSGDGRYVVFQSVANNLVTGDTNFTSDIFIRDLGGAPPHESDLPRDSQWDLPSWDRQ